ncbi:MAG: rhamnulokinase [Oscillospiraceae bacterium]|jgi:sugar (pentulose or hexulose) kinase|nr:rhamnulokinase [Oscillospiraceae bacterium]
MPGQLHGLAFDYGASSGRAILGSFDGEKLSIKEIHRFANEPVNLPDGLYWDAMFLYAQIGEGIRKAIREYAAPDSIGIDTWGVDFGLLDRTGRLTGNPVHYRDSRTQGMMERAFDRMPQEELFEHTGLAFLPFNTLYQLLALEGLPSRDNADKLLFTPDLFAYFLTGEIGAEYSIASTSQLINPKLRDWAMPVLNAFSIPRGWFPALQQPGSTRGYVRASLAGDLGVTGRLPVATAASHDTASAVCALPAEEGGRFAYISSGTWSLLGVEIGEPIIRDAVLRGNYTNEGGAFGTTRLLKNIMGLWIIQECRRVWRREGLSADYGEIARRASDEAPFIAFFDPDDDAFLPPGDMPGRIRAYCLATGQTPPDSPWQTARIVYESLAMKYRWTVKHLERDILGERIERLYVVGGGSQNMLLNRMTARALGIPVYAGPSEATAIGNLLMQAVSLGELKSLSDIRAVVRASFAPDIYEPDLTSPWNDAYSRFLRVTGLPE